MKVQNSKLNKKHATCYKIQDLRGSALVAVLVILAIALLVITAIMQNVLVDTSMSFNLKKSDEACNNAISGIEETSLRLIRDPDFSGTTLNMDDGNVTIEVTGDNPKTITAISKVNNEKYICKIQAQATYDENGILGISNIEEIY